jgi:hypothetical protein
MGRAIITSPKGPNERDGLPRLAKDPAKKTGGSEQQPEKPDTYRERLFKYIPAEVVTLYLGCSAIVASAKDAPHFLYWVIFLAGLAGTPYYLRSAQKVKAPLQLVISTLAFAVWIFALGEPFSGMNWYKQVYGALLLPIFTFVVANLSPGPQK